MPELLVGLAAGLILGSEWGLPTELSLVLGGLASLGLYFGSCLFFPYRRCWVCGSDDRVPDKRGNYRRRWFACWWCRGAKDNRRIGARMMGML